MNKENMKKWSLFSLLSELNETKDVNKQCSNRNSLIYQNQLEQEIKRRRG